MADKKEIPWEVATILSMVTISESVHVLPVAGGLLDQDSLYIHYYMHVVELREMRRKIDEHKERVHQQMQQQQIQRRAGAHR